MKCNIYPEYSGPTWNLFKECKYFFFKLQTLFLTVKLCQILVETTLVKLLSITRDGRIVPTLSCKGQRSNHQPTLAQRRHTVWVKFTHEALKHKLSTIKTKMGW